MTTEAVAATQEETVTTDATGMFPSTPPPDRPVPQPQAHRARITSVTYESGTSNETGQPWGALRFHFKSLETAGDDSLFLGLPQDYVNNPQVDPATLSDEPGPVNDKGNATPSIRAQYATKVRNSKGNGTIESIIKFAITQGHSVTLASVPTTIQAVAEYLNQLTVGTDVVALFRAQGGDGDFADRLRCTALGDIAQYENPKFFKNYRKVGLGE